MGAAAVFDYIFGFSFFRGISIVNASFIYTISGFPVEGSFLCFARKKEHASAQAQNTNIFNAPSY